MEDQAHMTEEQLIQILELIQQSRIIPDEHKTKYIQHIQKNGLSEKMVEELAKVFAKDAELLDGEVSEDKKVLSSLEEEIAKEQAEVDEPQAKVLAALEEFNEKNEKELEVTYEGMQKDIETFEVEGGEKADMEKEDEIRAKLQQKK